jgi:hypothetical protein
MERSLAVKLTPPMLMVVWLGESFIIVTLPFIKPNLLICISLAIFCSAK